MIKLSSISAILFFAMVAIAQTQSSKAQDPYTPKLSILVTNIFTGKPEVEYRFTEEQLTRIAQMKLETNRFVAYIERIWPIKRLQAYCVPTNILGTGQNLVAKNRPIETELYKGKAHGFSRVWVYVAEYDAHGTYSKDMLANWHRWEYSINFQRGKKYWVIIESLPNDFMDSPKYDVSEPQHPADGSQPSRSVTNSTPEATGSHR